MEICAFSPTGEVLAVAGRRGYVHLVDWKSGAGQVVGSLKMNAGVRSLWWARGGIGEGRELMSLSDNAEVYVWDIAGRNCTRRWQDHGGFGSCVINGDREGKYVAIGYGATVFLYHIALSTIFLVQIVALSTSTGQTVHLPPEAIDQSHSKRLATSPLLSQRFDSIMILNFSPSQAKQKKTKCAW